MSDEIINEVSEIKHMAFAVEDIDESLDYYKKYLGVSKGVQIQDMPKSRTRVAVFNIGSIEYQLCQSPLNHNLTPKLKSQILRWFLFSTVCHVRPSVRLSVHI